MSVIEKSNKKLLEDQAIKGYPFTISHADGKCEEIVHCGREVKDVLRRHTRTPLAIVPDREEVAAA